MTFVWPYTSASREFSQTIQDKCMEEKVSYIYKVTNLVNGKVYIGQSVDPIKRIQRHVNVRSKSGYLLNYAVKKYGVENFLFEVIRSEIPIEKINETEMQCIKEHNCKVPNGYNLTEGGSGVSKRKYVISEEIRKRISEALKNRSDELKDRFRFAQRGRIPWNKGKSGIYSQETLHKMQTARCGMKFTQEHMKKFIGAATLKKQKPVIDVESGIVYESIKAAAIANNIPRRTMSNILAGNTTKEKRERWKFLMQ